MSVHAIGASTGASSYSDAAEQITSTQGKLAVMMLEAQQANEQGEQQRLELARNSYKAALAEEVNEMHAAADSALLGALIQASISCAGGAMTISGALSREVPELSANPCDAEKMQFSAALQETDLEVTGKALQNFSGPLGEFASSQAGHHSASAKAHGGEAEMARWAIGDAQENIDESRELAQKAIDWADSLSDKDAAAMNAILANLA